LASVLSKETRVSHPQVAAAGLSAWRPTGKSVVVNLHIITDLFTSFHILGHRFTSCRVLRRNPWADLPVALHLDPLAIENEQEAGLVLRAERVSRCDIQAVSVTISRAVSSSISLALFNSSLFFSRCSRSLRCSCVAPIGCSRSRL